MAKIKALKVEKLVFVLPDNFVGDEADALFLAARYMKEQRRKQFETPTDPRANTKKATLEVLEGGGRIMAVAQIHTLEVPNNLASQNASSKTQSVVVPSLVIK